MNRLYYIITEASEHYHNKYDFSDIVSAIKFWDSLMRAEKSIELQTYDNVRGWYDAYTIPYRLVLPFEKYEKFVVGEIDEMKAKLRQKRAIIFKRIKL